ncbi:hypothetical protein ACFYS7_40130, partial [Streptomyces avermitilis]|uniref:hypothetical protein n=1 Tax=Streptomyces avermitilis TaxID=33903 RepID=UPI003684E0AC
VRPPPSAYRITPAYRRDHPTSPPEGNPKRSVTVGADLKLKRLGLGGLAGRNTARLAPTADVPASILAALTGTSVDTATDWTNFVKRYWTGYIASRRNDNQEV